MNSCFRVKGLLSAYLDREMTGEEMILMREHLANCQDCALEFEELRRVKSALIQIPDIEPGDEFFERMKLQVFESVEPVPVSRSKVAATIGMAAAVMFLLFAVLKWVDVQRQMGTGANPSSYTGSSETLAVGGEQRESYQPVMLVNAPE